MCTVAQDLCSVFYLQPAWFFFWDQRHCVPCLETKYESVCILCLRKYFKATAEDFPGPRRKLGGTSMSVFGNSEVRGAGWLVWRGVTAGTRGNRRNKGPNSRSMRTPWGNVYPPRYDGGSGIERFKRNAVGLFGLEKLLGAVASEILQICSSSGQLKLMGIV